MTDADIIRIAQESELWDAIGSIARVYGTINPAIIDFARRIRSATIAECAAVCDASSRLPTRRRPPAWTRPGRSPRCG